MLTSLKRLTLYSRALGYGSIAHYHSKLRQLIACCHQGEPNRYDVEGSFECLPCAPGCETCTGPRPCILDLDWVLRSSLLGVSVLIMCWIPMLVWFTVHYRDVKVTYIFMWFFTVHHRDVSKPRICRVHESGS